ncbi:hypothetical protein BVRB_023790, partial [Beta vulgaris subsp. vulgaris]
PVARQSAPISIYNRAVASIADYLQISRSRIYLSCSRDAYLSHIVRHILYGRRKVAEGDEILASDPDAEVRDQGFTQPKISNRKRFVEEFGPPNLDDDELNRFNAKPELYRAVIQGGADKGFHRLLFTKICHLGNFDDNFRIGIKLGNRSVKLYSEFYSVCQSLAIR